MSWGLSLLHGTDREICWIHVLLVKGSLCSEQRGTFCSKDVKSFITRIGTGNLLNSYATERNGTGILFNRLGMSWGLSLLHGPEREICWIDRHIRQKGTDREICGLKQWIPFRSVPFSLFPTHVCNERAATSLNNRYCAVVGSLKWV
jgi:hypothetical protein